jgi:glycosyltransferase involved in cell wall biosynthesis
MIAAEVLGIDYGISAHARDITEYPHLIKQKVKTARFISICNKNAHEKVLKEAGQENTENVHLIYHGYDPEILRMENPPPKDTPPLILLVGRYVEKKGIAYALEAAKILKDEDKVFKMVIVGGGILKEELNRKVTRFDLEKYVDLAGPQPHAKVVELLHKASVYIQPSIVAKSGDVDGIPNGLVEAALVGVPSITTNAGSISDFLTENNAIIVDQRNSKGLAEGIRFLLENIEEANNLAAKAHVKALKMFSPGNFTDFLTRQIFSR